MARTYHSFTFTMEHLFAESNTWEVGIDPSLDIPSEETYQRYLVNLHYQTIEYQNYSARFSPKRTAKLQWFATDIAVA